MKKVLIVSPNWPPASCPDMHRIRTALPYFEQFGWRPLILKIDPQEQEGIKDPELEETIPSGTRVWQAGCVSRRWTEMFGLRNVGIRSMAHLAALGSRVIDAEKPDLVFISTTMFPLMPLGRLWKRRHSLPYVLDWQDPWYVPSRRSDRPMYRTLKYRIAQIIARVLEPFAVRKATRLICVSPEYPRTLMRRYRWLSPDDFVVLPFGAGECDFERVANAAPPTFDGNRATSNWVYIGRGGADMAFAARSIFRALQRLRDRTPARVANLRLHFLGTDYAPPGKGQRWFDSIAAEYGLSDIVSERPERIPYLDTLRRLRTADALLVLGSDDPGYTASKIYPYALARRPLLAVFHRESSVVDFMQKTGAGTLVTFDRSDDIESVSQRVEDAWLTGPEPPEPRTDWGSFEPFTSREMTRNLCRIFDAAAHP